MNRGRRREDIFLRPDDFEAFLKIVRESAERWNARIRGQVPISYGKTIIYQLFLSMRLATPRGLGYAKKGENFCSGICLTRHRQREQLARTPDLSPRVVGAFFGKILSTNAL